MTACPRLQDAQTAETVRATTTPSDKRSTENSSALTSYSRIVDPTEQRLAQHFGEPHALDQRHQFAHKARKAADSRHGSKVAQAAQRTQV